MDYTQLCCPSPVWKSSGKGNWELVYFLSIIYSICRILAFLRLLHKVKSEIRLCWPPSLEANVSNHRQWWSIIQQLRRRKSNADIRTQAEKAASTAQGCLGDSQWQDSVIVSVGTRSVNVTLFNSAATYFISGRIHQSSFLPCRHTDNNGLKRFFKHANYRVSKCTCILPTSSSQRAFCMHYLQLAF